MPSQPTIPKLANAAPAFDPRQLAAVGLQHLQRLADKVWTDHNVHDPGITTLELFAYALTDLAYRATFPIQDIVAIDTDDPVKNARSMADQFFTAKTILTNRSLTARDYRKLLIDLPGVANAWLTPSAQTYYADPVKRKLSFTRPALPGIVEVNLAGLYDITVEYFAKADRGQTEKQIWQTLHKNRNLCEDFAGLSVVESQEFIICAEIELTSEADVLTTSANVLFAVQDYLSPMVPNHPLSEMLDRKKEDGTPRYSVEEIFDGPELTSGFIDEDELQKAELRTEIRLSDIISILMEIEGVRAIRDIVINPVKPKAVPENKWLIPVDTGKKPILNPVVSRLVLFKRNMPFIPDSAQLQAAYQDLVDMAVGKAEATHKDELDIPIPLGRFRNPGSYYSFQKHFPELYGLSDTSMPSDDNPRRQALALQLKAYLLFFDQFMADYLAQLGHVRDLFSTDSALEHSYFCQPVSFHLSENIYSVDGAKVAPLLQAIAEDPKAALARRSKFLDHLIARFAERFQEFVQIMSSVFGENTASLIARRCEFLKDYPRISSARGVAYDHTLQKIPALWSEDDVAGLERRLSRLLGLDHFARTGLAEVALDDDTRVVAGAGNTFNFQILNKGTAEVLLTSVKAYASQELARQALGLAIIRGSSFSDYRRSEPAQGNFIFTVMDGAGTDLARSDRAFDNTLELNAAVRDLVKYLRDGYPTREGLYLIENILLRPGDATEPFLPICADPGCTDCAEADPYSYRVHIILPGFSDHFRNMDFRRYAEDVIRSEMPAHILPKICWIGPEDMREVENAYRVWLMVKAGLDATPMAAALGALTTALNNAKSMYPSSHLGECGSDEKILLDRTTLGSMS